MVDGVPRLNTPSMSRNTSGCTYIIGSLPRDGEFIISSPARNIGHNITESGAISPIGTLVAMNMLKKSHLSSVEVGETAEASLRSPIRSGNSN
jgi:hypothetical protein